MPQAPREVQVGHDLLSLSLIFFPPPLMNAYKLLSLFVFFMKIAVVVHGLLYCITAHVTIKEVRYRISY